MIRHLPADAASSIAERREARTTQSNVATDPEPEKPQRASSHEMARFFGGAVRYTPPKETS